MVTTYNSGRLIEKEAALSALRMIREETNPSCREIMLDIFIADYTRQIEDLADFVEKNEQG